MTLTIGADPEYGLIDNGRLVSASSVITGGTDGVFGVDGCGRVAELRPQYSDTPGGLVNNIRKALLDGLKKHEALLKFRFKAGSVVLDEPIGGHVHFGSSSLKHPVAAERLAKALDRTVAVLCLMVEDQEEALNRRLGSSYGTPGNGNWREQMWGMEYRVLSSWLTSPKEAEAILSLAWIVAKEHENDELMEDACSLPGFDSQSFRECDKIGLLYYIPPIVKYIRSLPSYEAYERAIVPLFQLIKERKTWSCDKDMLDTWDLRNELIEFHKKEAKKEALKKEKKEASLV